MKKAYWLGFLYADGYITSRDKVGLSLAIKDRNHIEKFKSAIQSTHPIKEYSSFGYCETKYARLIFTSHEMTKDLKKLGCVEHKTLVLKFPNKDMVPNEYLNAFVRGYLDGDGCITTSGEKMPLCLKFCGTREFLSGLISYFNTLLYPEMIKNKIYKRHNDDKNTYQLDIHSFSKCKAILDELYRDAQVYLDRKYILYLQKATQQSSLPEMVDV